MFNPDLWFFILSTVSQTLAAIIALASTFVVYKLSRINYQLHNLNDEVRNLFIYELQEDDRIDNSIGIKYREVLGWFSTWISRLDLKKKEDEGEEQYIDFVAHVSDIFKISPTMITRYPSRFHDYLREKERYFRQLITDKARAHKYLRNSLIFTTTTITLSLITMPMFPLLTSHTMEYSIIGIIVGLGALSTIYTSVVVWRITRL